MIECGSRLSFLHKTIQFIRIFAEFIAQEFDRDLAIELCVLSKINLAHPALADLGQVFCNAKLSCLFQVS